MEYAGTLLAVTDMERSKRFYQEVLGLKITADFGANVTLNTYIFLQTLDTWKDFLNTDAVTLEHHAGEVYFEEPELDALLVRLEKLDVRYVHPPMEHRWGQRAVRFYDPDGHVIEVAEPIQAVVRRFAAQGLSVEQTAERMDVSLEYVKNCID